MPCQPIGGLVSYPTDCPCATRLGLWSSLPPVRYACSCGSCTIFFPISYWNLRTRGRNSLKFGMQVYHDHIHNWFDFGPLVDQKTWNEIGVSCIVENAWKERSEIWHAVISWLPWELMWFLSWSEDFLTFAKCIFDLAKWIKFWVLWTFWGSMEWMGWVGVGLG